MRTKIYNQIGQGGIVAIFGRTFPEWRVTNGRLGEFLSGHSGHSKTSTHRSMLTLTVSPSGSTMQYRIVKEGVRPDESGIRVMVWSAPSFLLEIHCWQTLCQPHTSHNFKTVLGP